MKRKRARIYCRVAHSDAHALTVLQASLEAYAETHGFGVVGTTAEQASGLDFSRHGLAEVSGAVAAGEVDILLMENLSCLGREHCKGGRLPVLAGRSVCQGCLCR